MLQRGNFILLLLFFLVTPFSPYLNRFRTLKDEALRLKGGSSITAALTQQDKTKLLVGKCAAIMQVYNPHPSLLSFLLIYFICFVFLLVQPVLVKLEKLFKNTVGKLGGPNTPHERAFTHSYGPSLRRGIAILRALSRPGAHAQAIFVSKLLLFSSSSPPLTISFLMLF